MRELSQRNILRRIEDLANNLAKDYTNLHLIPRGTPVFPDKGLRGTIRFAKRQGNFLPTISPENSVYLTKEVVPPINKITVNRTIPGLTDIGTMISIGPGRELARISDVNATTGEIVTEVDLIGNHAVDTPVDMFGVPILIVGNWAAGSETIQIRSSSNVFIGDQIAIDTTKGLINSTVSTIVTDAQFLGSSGGLNIYSVTLAEGTSRSTETDEVVYLRSQPGYQSQQLRVSLANGPFVLDHISGPFFEDTEIDEFLNLQLFDSIGLPLIGYEKPVSVGKNFAVAAVKIRAESMLFWDVVVGGVQFHNGKFVGVTDENGRFVLSKELVPVFSPGTEWDVPVISDATAQLRVMFEPNDFRNFSLSNGILQRIGIGMGSGEEPASRIEIVIQSSHPGARVEFNDWIPRTAVSYISYQITSTAYGSNVWQSGSLMLKPYFFTLEDITAKYDFSAYDQGVVHF